MNTLISNPGLHHLVFKIFGYLDFDNLKNLSWVSKQFYQFMSQREIWIRVVNKLQIIQKPSKRENCKYSGKGLLLDYYKKKSKLSELKNFARLMEKHCNNKNLYKVIEEAIESENVQFIELFLKAPPGFKSIYPITMDQLILYSTKETKFKIFKFILTHAHYWNLKPFEIEEGEVYSLLRYAALCNNIEGVKLILSHKDFNENDANISPALKTALTEQNLDIVRVMVASPKIDVNQDAFLHLTCGFETTDYVKLFLARSDINVNMIDRVNITTSYCYTPLYRATWEDGNPEIVKLLLQREDIDVNLGSDDGFTPLHRACSSGNPEIVKLLLNAKDINVNIQDMNGETPLHVASRVGYLEIVKLLLHSKNLNINAQDIDGDTPLRIA